MFSPIARKMKLNSSRNNRLLRTYLADGLKQLRFMPREIILPCFTNKNIHTFVLAMILNSYCAEISQAYFKFI